MKRALTLALAALLLAGCTAPATPPATPAAAPPSPGVTCETPGEDLVDSLFDVEYDFTVIEAAAVRSPDHEKVWYIAASATDGENDVVGIWGTNGLEGTVSVRSVDGIAREFSSWPDGRKDGMSLTDSAAKAAKACVES